MQVTIKGVAHMPYGPVEVTVVADSADEAVEAYQKVTKELKLEEE